VSTEELRLKLKKIPFFTTLKDEILVKLCQISATHTYRRDDIVYEEGDRALTIDIILSGEGLSPSPT